MFLCVLDARIEIQKPHSKRRHMGVRGSMCVKCLVLVRGFGILCQRNTVSCPNSGKIEAACLDYINLTCRDMGQVLLRPLGFCDVSLFEKGLVRPMESRNWSNDQ